MTRNLRLFAIPMALLLAAACSDDDKAPGSDTGVDKGAPVEAGVDKSVPKEAGADGVVTPDKGPGTDGTVAKGVKISGKLTEFGSNVAVPDVDVCVKEAASTPCVKSDKDGKFSIEGPEKADFHVTMKKTGYLSYASAYGNGQKDTTYNTLLLTETLVGLMATALGTTVKKGEGHIIFTASGASAGTAGVSFKMAKAAGEGPFYLGTSGMPDKKLTATTAAGQGTYMNLPAGDYVLSFSSATAKCALHHGVPGATAADVKVKVFADMASVVILACQ